MRKRHLLLAALCVPPVLGAATLLWPLSPAIWAQAPAATEAFVNFDKLLFAYGTWENKVKIENGRLLLVAPNSKGGGGDNFAFDKRPDLSARREMSPMLRLKVNADNKAKLLRLQLGDTKEGSGVWHFSLEGLAPGAEVLVAPNNGDSLARPASIGEKGGLDLSQVMQWQVQGDWSDGAVDVEILSIALATPDAKILAARAARAQNLVAETEAARKVADEQRAKYLPGLPASPTVEHVGMVAPDVIAVEIQAGRVVPANFSKYVAQTGDVLVEKKNDKGDIEAVILQRGGQDVGWLLGPKRDWMTTMESIAGDPLLLFEADDASNFSVSSPDDPAWKTALKATSAFRKSKPNEWAQGPSTVGVRHILYLKMPRALAASKKYSINLGRLNTRARSVDLTADAARVRSEAVHVNQIGFRPDDPAKRAFISCWMGTGGALKLRGPIRFSLVDDKSGKAVFTGTSSDIWPADKPELMGRDANFNGTDVARLDFSAFKTPGRFRVAVEAVGSSYPFEIGADVWKRAFLTQMRGLFHQRSGIALGPPHTTYVKPRDMHPADGYRVTKTRHKGVEGGEAWAAIPAGDTGEAADGWGGYHDAGDWNPRRVTHMKTTMATLEMLELFPKYFEPLRLNIPARVGVPDILTEAMWEVDCFRRLQHADGGVPHGLESKGDPLTGEVSWLNSFPSYAFAPDYAASWCYAAAASRLAFNLQKHDPKLAATYRESAVRAFAWAETDWARDRAAGKTAARGNTWEATDWRNMAALELYRLTSDKKYHDVFLQGTSLKDAQPELFAYGKAVQRDHAFLYARLPANVGDEAMKKKAVASLEVMAQRCLDFASNNAFNVTTPDKGKPQFIGYYSNVDATDLTRAHFLTRTPKYLEGALRATQFQSGANPSNMVYMTGLGANPVKNVFKLDARRTGQAVPAGLVPYGNIDFAKWTGEYITWPITWVVGKDTVPNAYSWPTHEAYWDVGGWPMLEEFTVDNWAPNVLVWGYLAARN